MIIRCEFNDYESDLLVVGIVFAVILGNRNLK